MMNDSVAANIICAWDERMLQNKLRKMSSCVTTYHVKYKLAEMMCSWWSCNVIGADWPGSCSDKEEGKNLHVNLVLMLLLLFGIILYYVLYFSRLHRGAKLTNLLKVQGLSVVQTPNGFVTWKLHWLVSLRDPRT